MEDERLSGDYDLTDKTAGSEIDVVPEAEDNSDIEDISSQIKEKPKKKTEEESVKQFRRKKHGWVKWLVIGLIVAGIAGFVVYNVIETKRKLQDALADSGTTTATVTRMDLSKAINATGTIQSKDVRTITSPLTGVKIDEVNCKVGDMVTQGDVIVTFSREDINKKIGQIEEDITEQQKLKNLDGKNRENTYVNNYDLQTYSVATAYDTLNQKAQDLQKAKDELQKACNDKADFKSKYEEAKDKIGSAKDDLYNKEVEYKNWQVGKDLSKDPYYKEDLEWKDRISQLESKVKDYQSTIDGYDKSIETYESTEKTKREAVETAQRTYDDAYVKYNKAGYDSTFANAKTDYDYTSGIVKANDNIKQLERQKEQNEDSLDNYIVTAPISGLVTAVNAQEGNGYQATTGALLTIQAVDVYEVTTQIDEYDINNVRIGQNVAIMTDATGDDELSGKVTFIAPTATSSSSNGSSGGTSTSSGSSSTFEVKIDIDKKDERLRLGMSAKLNILIDTHKNVLAVPYDAIEEVEGKTVVYVADNAAPADNGDDSLGIQVVGVDGLIKQDDKPDDKDKKPQAAGKPRGKEIPVQIGLESDYYTEVISDQLKEGMTVLVNSTAGELENEMPMFMGM